MDSEEPEKRWCYSRGNINAPIMIIAQNPGIDEVEHKEIDEKNHEEVNMPIPLCGITGRLAHKWLIWLGINEGEYIITNIIKHTCLQEKETTYGNKIIKRLYNRSPSIDEILNGRKELIKEIAKIDPKMIITLGKEALWGLIFYEKISIDEMPITKVCGTLHTYEYDINEILFNIKNISLKRKVPVLPLLHPSAVVRDQGQADPRGYKELVAKAMTANKPLIENALGRISI